MNAVLNFCLNADNELQCLIKGGRLFHKYEAKNTPESDFDEKL